MTRIVAIVLIAVGMPAAAHAQTPSDDRSTPSARPVPLVLDIQDSVRKAAWQGAREPFAAVSAQATTTNRRVRHPVLLGAAIGAGAGFVLNASACRTGESVCTGAGNLMMAGIGAGVGAIVGLLVSR